MCGEPLRYVLVSIFSNSLFLCWEWEGECLVLGTCAWLTRCGFPRAFILSWRCFYNGLCKLTFIGLLHWCILGYLRVRCKPLFEIYWWRYGEVWFFELQFVWGRHGDTHLVSILCLFNERLRLFRTGSEKPLEVSRTLGYFRFVSSLSLLCHGGPAIVDRPYFGGYWRI